MKKGLFILAGLIIVIGAVLITFNKNSGELLLDDFEGELSAQTVDFGAGAGSELKVSGSKDIKYSGEQAIKLEYKSVSGGYMWFARGYNLDVKGAACWLKEPKDIKWHKYSALSFYMYGQNTGVSLAVDVIDKEFEYFRFMIKDDFSGWKQIICPFDQFFARGDWQPQKANKNANLDFPINAFQFEPRSIAEGAFYFDYAHLIEK